MVGGRERLVKHVSLNSLWVRASGQVGPLCYNRLVSSVTPSTTSGAALGGHFTEDPMLPEKRPRIEDEENPYYADDDDDDEEEEGDDEDDLDEDELEDDDEFDEDDDEDELEDDENGNDAGR